MLTEPNETLVCDTSFVGHLWRRLEEPARYAHWDPSVIDRVEAAVLAISIVTIAECRSGHLKAGWGIRRVARDELALAALRPILIDNPHVEEWARLSAAARSHGIAIGDNDLWIAATACVREGVLVTCDRDHVRIARDLPVEVVYLQPPLSSPPV